jgi:uncharacterized protein YjdB/beta-N-acetylglucosaminidase
MRVVNTNSKISIKKIFKYVVVMTMVLSISMPCFFNIVNAAIYAKYTTLPMSRLEYDSADNSSVFPDSYKAYIKNLKVLHPNWTFKAVYTGLDWTESVTQESYEVKNGISLVPDTYSSNWKKDGIDTYVDGSFVIASKKAVAYTMDPRNYLNETGIFQFEALDFNAGTSTTSTIEKIIAGTPMATYPTQYKRIDGMATLANGLTWSQVIVDAAKNAGGNGISAVFLASRMKQETSLELLNNGSINGSSTTYPCVYNFLNIGAIPNVDGSGSVTNGLKYASYPTDDNNAKLYNRDGTFGWTTPIYSIEGGAKTLWSSYIKWGQNTIYFQKFDVNNPPKDPTNLSLGGIATGLYAFQYMTNILAPSSESIITYNAYVKSGIIKTATDDSSFIFNIPVYENMPSAISAHPDSEITASTITGTDIVYLDDGKINGTDYFNIRSGAGEEFNVIGQIVELSEGAENRTKFTRTQVGTNGWDKIRLANGTEGYVYQAFVYGYDYTHVTGVQLDKSTATLKVGDTTTLIATISPTNAYIKNLTWNSSNSNVATVDGNGKVTASTLGTTNITATTLDGTKVATCAVTVEKTLASSISVPNTEYPLLIGNYLQLTPSVLPATTTDASYEISIADTTVAIVESGKIKGLKTGDTVVTLTTKDGSNKSCTFTLKVTENVATINNLTVDTNSIITKVALGSTVSSIKENITTNYTKKLLNASGTALVDTDKVGTGTKVQILDGTNVLQEYSIVIYGDISGDGQIDVVDLLMLKRKLTNKLVLGEYANKAANIAKTGGEPDVTDLLRLKRHLTNKSLIVQ